MGPLEVQGERSLLWFSLLMQFLSLYTNFSMIYFIHLGTKKIGTDKNCIKKFRVKLSYPFKNENNLLVFIYM